MFEVLTSYDQVLAISARDLLVWLEHGAWRERHQEAHATPILFFEATPPDEASFIFLDPSGVYHRAGSIEAALRTAIWHEITSTGKPFIKEFIPQRHRRRANRNRLLR